MEFLSDWHVGRGTGIQGMIDATVDRDQDELPFVPGKTLRGIWRAASRRVAAALGDGWPEWVDVVFGSSVAHGSGGPIRLGRIDVAPAGFAEKERRALVSTPVLASALVSLRPGLAIDPESGVTKDRTFRITEVAMSGITLESEVAVDTTGWSDQQVQSAMALLWGGAKAIDRLGGKRRRGLGRCRVQVTNVDGSNLPENLLETLKKAPASPPAAVHTSQTDQSGVARRNEPESARDADEWLVFDIPFEAVQPLVIEDHTQGNVVLSLDHVPGSQLLGPVVAALPGAWEKLFAGVTDGRIRVLDGRLADGGERGRPVPLLLYYDKASADPDAPVVANAAVETDFESLERPKQLRGGHLLSDQRVIRSRRSERTHNVIDEAKQRPTTELGGVYSYQAIPSGTMLVARLLVSSELAKEWPGDWVDELTKKLNAARLSLGLATDDYGAAHVGTVAETTLADAPDGEVSEVRMWALSPLLLRDEALRPSTDLAVLCCEVRRRLIQAGVGQTKVSARERAWVRSDRRGGWVRAWRLPRGTLTGVAAGSCVTLCFDPAVPRSKLHWVEQAGLGERTAEGFGEVVFDDPLTLQPFESVATLIGEQKVAVSESAEPTNGNGELLAYLRPVALARWVERAVFDLAADKDRRRKALHIKGKRPSKAQLGSLRSTALRLVDDETALVTWLADLEGNDRRQAQWRGRHSGGTRKAKETPQAFRELIQPCSEKVWQVLGGAPKAFAVQLRKEAWAATLVTLIDRCIAEELRSRERGGSAS